MMRLKRLSPLLALALMAAFSLPTKAVDQQFAEETTAQFAQLESLARGVRTDAGALETFTRMPELYSTDLQELKLNTIKRDINKMAKIVERVHQNRSEAKAWQVQLIDRILPKMQTLSSNVESAIRHITKNPEHLFAPNYKVMVSEIHDQADGIVRYTDTFTDWANAQARKENLTKNSM